MPLYKNVNGEQIALTPQEEADLIAEKQAQAELVKTYAGKPVTSADEVDRVTVQRIRDLIAPNKPADLQASAEIKLNAVTNYLNAKTARGHSLTQAQKDALDANIALWDAIEVIRAEGVAFKVAHGWSAT